MRSALGKGLNALISDETAAAVTTAASSGQSPMSLPIHHVSPNPKQPRKHFDAAALTELVASIKEKGILQPILVASVGEGKYEIIAGERRWRAAKQAGLEHIPALVRAGTEAERFELAIIENVQRQDLNPIEQAEGYKRLHEEFSMTQEAIARVIGKDRAVVANTMRLLHLPEIIRAAVSEGKISMGHARALLAVSDASAQRALYERIVSETLSVRSVELAAKDHQQAPMPGAKNPRPAAKSAEIKAIEEKLQQHLGRKVELQTAGPSAAKGWLRLEFYSLEDFETLLQQLQKISHT